MEKTNQNIKQIILCRGLPGSGKTTWALSHLVKHPGQWKRVNKDDLRNMIDGGAWSKKNEKLILKARDELIELYLKEGFSVIVDDTNFADVHLRRITEIAKKHRDIPVTIQDFSDVPLKECIARDAKRENPVGAGVIKKMWKQFLAAKHIAPYKEPEYSFGLPDCIIIDIDGTVAHMNGRSPYDYEKVDTDTPDKTVINLIEIFKEYNDRFRGKLDIFFVSGRPDNCKVKTEEWLNKYIGVKYKNLYMRKAGDMRKDVIVKQEIYKEHFEGKYNVLFVLDDRNQTVEGWRELGLKCLQVAPGDF